MNDFASDYRLPGEDLPGAVTAVSLLLGLLCLGGAIALQLGRQEGAAAGRLRAEQQLLRAEQSPVDPAAEPAREPVLLCPPLFSVPFAPMQAMTNVEPRRVEALAGWLLRHPQASLMVDGYADGQGPADRNVDLSQRRAGFVARLFLAKGLVAERVLVRGFGFDPVVGDPSLLTQRRVRLSVPGYSSGRCPAEVL